MLTGKATLLHSKIFTATISFTTFLAYALTMALIVSAIVMIKATAQSSTDAQLFGNHCAACHSIGDGQRKVGPDLAKVSNWPVQKLRLNVERMQSNSGPLSSSEIDSLVNFLKSQPQSNQRPGDSVSNYGNPVQSPAQSSPPAYLHSSGPGLWESTGAKLYSGRLSLSGGGMSCMVCHSIQGGGQGPSLNEIAHEKTGGRLVGFLQNPRNRAMSEAYSNHPITIQESLALSQYFASLGRQGERGESGERGDRFRREDDDD